MSRVEISSDGKRYCAANLIIRHATEADDEALQIILAENPMQGWLRLAQQRSPSYFAGEDLMGHSIAIIGEDAAKDNAIIGMYHTSFLPLYINGQVVKTGYLGELRVNQSYRSSLRIIKHGFASIRSLTRAESTTTQLWFTSIASDNHVARRLLEADNPKLPRYTPRGELQTLAISTHHGKRPTRFQPAIENDIPTLCEFHQRQASQLNFAPCLDPSWLGGLSRQKGLTIEDFLIYKRDGRIEACIALWDQRPFKQLVVQGYRSPLNYLRGLYNIFAYLSTRPLLPGAHSILESLYLSFFCCSKEFEEEATELVQEALYLASRRGAKIGLIGVAAGNPLLARLKKSFRPTIYKTCIESVSWRDEKPPELNDAPIQPEIALL
ncbi:MAG: hypothetical protein ABW087_14585 [Candidatus Thiodiazotropha sp.]